jgi:hypothetical protein
MKKFKLSAYLCIVFSILLNSISAQENVETKIKEIRLCMRKYRQRKQNYMHKPVPVRTEWTPMVLIGKKVPNSRTIINPL